MSEAKGPQLRPDITPAALTARGEGFLPGLMGIEAVSVEPGRLTARAAVRGDLLAPNQFLHAAAVVALADTAAGYATIAHLPQGAESFTTIELKTNFMGTVREGAIVAEAIAQHLGRNTQVWDAVVSDETSGRRIALFRCTQMILWPK